GIGDLGPEAHRWVTQLARARQRWWQILPVGPTGYADSPYQSLSSFAGNINLLSPELLLEDRLLTEADLPMLTFGDGPVDYAAVIPFKRKLLHRAWQRFEAKTNPSLQNEFAEFCARECAWLSDFCLFLALKDAFGGKQWMEWPREHAFRGPAAMARARREHAEAIDVQAFGQFLFFRQWQRLRDHARTEGISLIGDLPIFVAFDSADVWAHPEL